MADVGSFVVVGSDPGVVEVGAEVLVLRLVVVEQVPDDDQDRTSDRDDRFLLAASAGDPAVALTEEGVGPSGADRGFAENPGGNPLKPWRHAL